MIEKLAAFVGMLMVFSLLWAVPQPGLARLRVAWAAAPAGTIGRSGAKTAAAVVPSSGYAYVAPPSISRAKYIAVYTANGSPAADEAGGIYDLLVGENIDPAVHAAQAMHETGLGTAGVGKPAYKNMHGVQCFNGDGRAADSPVPWGNGCAGIYASYLDAVRTWAGVIKREYVAQGLDTPDKAIWKYAPVSDGNDPQAYINDMHSWINRWRAEDTPPAPPSGARSNVIGVGGDAMGVNVRAALDARGGALRDVRIRPGETWSFNATVGDPGALQLATIVHPGDGWCNLAARYAQVSRALGIQPQFEDHGMDLGAGRENSVAIWNIGGQSGSDGDKQDLEITNTLDRPVRFQAQQDGESVTIVGSVE